MAADECQGRRQVGKLLLGSATHQHSQTKQFPKSTHVLSVVLSAQRGKTHRIGFRVLLLSEPSAY
uniref:Uncharacterized protein n=1 Tax=Anguilla anguilla TaxID=7936 RepID=A0A0E9Q4R1_ANGAN